MAEHGRLIDVDALMAEMHNIILEDGEDRRTFYEVIERQPTIEPEQKTGDQLPSAQPYTDAEIQKMQELEQAEIQKAYELGREEGQKEAQPEHRWIPCKTALPEKGQYVLCQCRAGIMDVLHLTDDNGWYKDSTHIYMHGFVLAWMPLPEPYREEGEE